MRIHESNHMDVWKLSHLVSNYLHSTDGFSNFFRLFHILTILVSLLNSGSVLACYTSIFSFGDSLTDTGNILYSHRSGADGLLQQPYGMTYFHRPTGRCSNGRLMVDFLDGDRVWGRDNPCPRQPAYCFPAFLNKLKSDSAEDYDPQTGCLRHLNEFSDRYNRLLKRELDGLRALHPHATNLYADYYNAAMPMYISPHKYGKL
ncbi:hypothetical protein ACLOJK_010473 [Asimina triloba]